ncbi:VanZ family protein [bacterium]|nr:VanZ family protein [bacterium]
MAGFGIRPAARIREPAIPPPRFITRWQTWVLLGVLLLLPFFITIPVELRKHPVVGPLGDQFHVLLLGAITLVLYWAGPLRGRIWWSALAASLMGVVIEFAQLLVGRSAYWGDVVLDMVGTGIVVGFVSWRGLGRRWGLPLMVLCAIYVPWVLRDLPADTRARRFHRDLFPVIEDFENPHLGRMWAGVGDGAVGFPPIPDGPDGPTFVLRITGAPPSTWPGARMSYFPHDWRGYDRLVLRARHRGPDDWIARFTIKVDDERGKSDDGAVLAYHHATAEWREYELPIEGQVGRNTDLFLDLRDVSTLSVFLNSPGDTVVLEIDDVRLEKSGGPEAAAAVLEEGS